VVCGSAGNAGSDATWVNREADSPAGNLCHIVMKAKITQVNKMAEQPRPARMKRSALRKFRMSWDLIWLEN
jgi:hypothetical protein